MDKNSQRYSEKRFGAYLCQDFGGGQKKSPYFGSKIPHGFLSQKKLDIMPNLGTKKIW